MASWKFKNLDLARDLISGERMDSAGIGADPVAVQLEPNLSFDAGGARLSFNPRGEASISILNDEQDRDLDGVAVDGDSRTPEGTLPPHLRLKDGPWLKLRAEAGVKAKVAADLTALVGITAGGDAAVVIADYRKCQPGETAREAFLSAIESSRFCTVLDHVKGLRPGDAVLLRRGGAVTASVSVSAADLFTGQIGTLSRVLGSAGPIFLSFEAGATLDFEVTVDDEFLIVFSRDKNAWRAGVRKAHATTVTAGADAGITARLEEPGALQQIAEQAVESAIGEPLARLDALLAKATLEDLDPAQKKVFDAVVERLRPGGAIATLQGLRDRVSDLRHRAGELIGEVLATRVTLSFAYEYSRIDSRTNLLQVSLTERALTQCHADLVAGRITAVLQAVNQRKPGITLESYLNQRTTERKASWGFTLGLGKWATVGGKDFRAVKEVERINAAGGRQRSYLGTRGYRGSWVGDSFGWSVDLRADMKGYANPVKVSSYTFGLHLAWTASQESLSADEIEQWVDLAQLWQVVGGAGAIELRAALAPALKRDANLSVQLTVPNSVLRSILPSLAASSPDAFAGPLAAAMPWLRRHEARQSAGRRRAIYTPLWTKALNGARLTAAEWARAASDHLREQGESELAFFERSDPGTANPFTLAGLVEINGNAREICQRFATGARVLHSTISNDEEDKRSIPAAFKLMDDLWTQSHHVRAVGVRLLELAAETGQLADVTRTMLVQGGGLERDVVITA